VAEFNSQPRKTKPLRKITKQRLKNIGLYYLKRFESSVQNLRQVLMRRVNDYARQNPEFDRTEAAGWIEELLAEFQNYHYLDDDRYAGLKIRDYLNAGKPERYIKNKLRQKGIDEKQIDALLTEQSYDPKEMALAFAKKKKIGPFRLNEDDRRENRQKDLGTMVRAGFDYDVVCDVLQTDASEFE